MGATISNWEKELAPYQQKKINKDNSKRTTQSTTSISTKGLERKEDGSRFKEVPWNLKQLHTNVPLVDTLEQMLVYATFC